MATNTATLTSAGYIAEARTSILCDGYEVENIIDEFGTDVWIRVVSKSFPNEYGDATETYVDYKRRAIIMSYSADDSEVKEGIFKSGEVVFSFLKSDEALIKPGNRVKYDVWYQIEQVMKQPLVDTLYYLQARVKKT